jgi:hypothetical protein
MHRGDMHVDPVEMARERMARELNVLRPGDVVQEAVA